MHRQELGLSEVQTSSRALLGSLVQPRELNAGRQKWGPFSDPVTDTVTLGASTGWKPFSFPPSSPQGTLRASVSTLKTIARGFRQPYPPTPSCPGVKEHTFVFTRNDCLFSKYFLIQHNQLPSLSQEAHSTYEPLSWHSCEVYSLNPSSLFNLLCLSENSSFRSLSEVDSSQTIKGCTNTENHG